LLCFKGSRLQILPGNAAKTYYCGYLDFARLYTFTQNIPPTFITKAKSNFNYRCLYHRKVEKVSMAQALTDNALQNEIVDLHNQLLLFNL